MNWFVLKEITGKRQDRLIAFFDAVLAIAVTVLALETAIPSVGAINTAELRTFVVSITGYLISFIAMVTLWYIHTKFFSMYSLTGKSSEIVLHLVLLFVITLFQPATKAVGLYRDDAWVKGIYIGIFLAMNIINIIIMLVVMKNNAKADKRKEYIEDIFKRDRIEKSHEDFDDYDRILHIVYGINHPDRIMEILSDHLPEEYSSALQEQVEERKKTLRLSLISTVEMLIAIVCAVIALTYSIVCCYIALAIGITVTLITNLLFNINSKDHAYPM